MSTLLVGLVLVASMKTVGGVILTWQVIDEQHDGMALATELMGEIMQARYIEPDDTEAFGLEGSESSASRALWDDSDDYDGWSKSPPQAKDGTALSGYTGWTRSVDVKKTDAGAPNSLRTDISDDKGLRKITVTVTAPDGSTTVLVGLKAELGVMEQAPSAETTYVSGVGSQLQIGTGNTEIRSGTNVSNHAQDQ